MLTAALVSLSVVFVAELGDKSQLMTMTYALRHRWWVVLSGVGIASFLVHGLSVTIGHFLGLTLPAGATPARLAVIDETATDVTAKLTCDGLVPGTAVRVEQRRHAWDPKPEWSRSITPSASSLELEVAFDADALARFQCVQ